nr:MAG TPA: YmzC-like protein [Caudoviricetes sp.]
MLIHNHFFILKKQCISIYYILYNNYTIKLL